MLITVNMTGSKELEAKLKRLGTVSFAPAMRKIGEELAIYYSTVPFANQGFPGKSKWAPLSPRTIAEKTKGIKEMRAGVSPSAPLIRTGEMKDSFEFQAAQTWARISNKSDHFKYHQLGTRNTPQRLMMGFNTTVSQMVLRSIQDVLLAEVR